MQINLTLFVLIYSIFGTFIQMRGDEIQAGQVFLSFWIKKSTERTFLYLKTPSRSLPCGPSSFIVPYLVPSPSRLLHPRVCPLLNVVFKCYTTMFSHSDKAQSQPVPHKLCRCVWFLRKRKGERENKLWINICEPYLSHSLSPLVWSSSPSCCSSEVVKWVSPLL